MQDMIRKKKQLHRKHMISFPSVANTESNNCLTIKFEKMKTKMLMCGIVLIGGLFLTTTAVSAQETKTEKKSECSQTALYTCPMHPDVIQNKPGKCPKCGMDLVKKESKTVYSCPMHPEVTSDKPGKCPKCGMDLKEIKEQGMHKDNDTTMMQHEHEHHDMNMDQ
jgi:hypothetical protein